MPLPSPHDLRGRILVKNKKRHRPATGVPDSSVRKRPLEQSNSALSESSAATEPSSPQLGRPGQVLGLGFPTSLSRPQTLTWPNPALGSLASLGYTPSVI